MTYNDEKYFCQWCESFGSCKRSCFQPEVIHEVFKKQSCVWSRSDNGIKCKLVVMGEPQTIICESRVHIKENALRAKTQNLKNY
eukprot:UN23911